jgi:hypothetical protein
VEVFSPGSTARAVEGASVKTGVAVALPAVALPATSPKTPPAKTVPPKSVEGSASKTVKPKTAKSETKVAETAKAVEKATTANSEKTPAAAIPVPVPPKESVSSKAATAAPAPIQGPKVYPITSVFVKEELPEEKTLPSPPPPAPLDLGVAPEVSLFPEWARSVTSETQAQAPVEGTPVDSKATTQTTVVKTSEPSPVTPVEPNVPEIAAASKAPEQTDRAIPDPTPSPTPSPAVTNAPPVPPETTGTLIATPAPKQPVQIAAAAPVTVSPKPGPAGAKAPAAKNDPKAAVVKPHPLPTSVARPLSPTAPTREKPLDLNAATRAQLMELPGVDGIRADLILAHRRAIRSFRATTQLREVYGISDTIWEQVADLVTVVPGTPGASGQPGVAASAPKLPLGKVLKPALPQSPVRPQSPTPPVPPVAPPATTRPNPSALPSSSPPAGK